MATPNATALVETKGILEPVTGADSLTLRLSFSCVEGNIHIRRHAREISIHFIGFPGIRARRLSASEKRFHLLKRSHRQSSTRSLS